MYVMGKTERIEARVEPETAQRIRYASELLHTSVSRLMVDAASEKAERVIAESTWTELPADYLDRVVSELDTPPTVIPALRSAATSTAADPAFKQA